MMKKIISLFSLLLINISCYNKSNSNDLALKSDKLSQIEGNKAVIKNLISHGDNLLKPREVFHWIYFKTEDDRRRYKQIVSKQDFIFVHSGFVDGDYRYELEIKRVDKVDIESVNQYVLYLWELANEHHGNYDGWETSIETD